MTANIVRLNLSAVAFLALGAGAAIAKDAANPDWPCVQRKVADLTVGAVWQGPSIDGLKGWWEDKELMAVLDTLASRRVPLDEAGKKLKSWAATLPADQRDAKLTLLFAGLFDKLTMQRRTVMSGLEKFIAGLRERAADIEKQGSELGALEAKAMAGDDKVTTEMAAAQDKYDWASRIYQERQNSIPIACEVPVIIEQRLFQAGELIMAELAKK